MPQSVTYIARRSLVSGHTEGGAYSINLEVSQKDRTRKVVAFDAVAIGGATWTTYHRGENRWRIETAPLQGADADNVREFLDSVEDGQLFTFDPTYTAGASPSDRRTVRLESNSYTERRAIQRGDDQSGDFFVFAFDVRQI